MPAESSESILELSLSRTSLDRSASYRKDPQALPRFLSDPQTRVLDLYGDRAPYEGEPGARRLRYRSPRPEGEPGLVVLLGVNDGTAYLAVVHDGEHDGEDTRANLRTLGMELSDLDVGVLASAVGIANWHAAQGFCSRCGAATEATGGGWVRVCSRDGSTEFPRTDPAVIMAVVDDQDRLLLARGPQWPPGRLSVLAGFVEPGESLEAAVVREVSEEVGIAVTDVVYRGNQPWPFPRSLMLGFRARAVTTELVLDQEEIAEARWVHREELAELVSAGQLGIPPHLSIARHLIEDWFGEEISEPS